MLEGETLALRFIFVHISSEMKILFIGLVWPEPQSSAAGWRILQLVEAFTQIGEVHFACAAAKSKYSFPLAERGIKEHAIVLNDASFDAFVEGLQPDIVVFDRFMVEEQYGWRVAEKCPKALRILDTEDLHFLRLAREQSFKRKTELDLHTYVAKRELASILRSDISLMISKYEILLLKEQFLIPEEKLFYIPFQEKRLEDDILAHLPVFEERQHLVFIGNFMHEPNFRTVEILKREIWPRLSKVLTKAELHIYGAYAGAKVMQLHNPKQRFHVKGRAEKARDTLAQYRVLVAPIPFGAGAKGKFVDAMAVGTPSVTTPIGAEDMSIDNLWSGFVAEDYETMVQRCVQLYSDKEIWLEKQRQGIKLFNQTVADDSFTKALVCLCRQRVEDLADYRKKYFLGEILLLQQLNATKYMSLWIEEKNKREHIE